MATTQLYEMLNNKLQYNNNYKELEKTSGIFTGWKIMKINIYRQRFVISIFKKKLNLKDLS